MLETTNLYMNFKTMFFDRQANLTVEYSILNSKKVVKQVYVIKLI